MTELAGLVARRICHDFAGPVGAIAMAVGLLEGTTDDEIHALIAESAHGLTALLRLYRTILATGSDAQSTHEVKKLLSDWVVTRQGLELDWRIDTETIDASTAAVLLGLSMIASEALTRGGRLTVEPGEISVDGTGLRLDQDVSEALTGVSTASTPRAALARLVVANADAAGITIDIAQSAPVLRLRYSAVAAG